jgi:hypothetical protein
MNAPYRMVATATLVPILLACPAGAKDKHLPLKVQVPAPGTGLYSARALRRARTILQLRLMELHAARLECVRRAVEESLLGRSSEIWHCAKQSQALPDM